MNCFSHAFRFLHEDPHFVVGTVLPDWLTLVDRKVRVRTRGAEPFVADREQSMRGLARGIIQHHADDAWFHGCRAFVELNLAFSIELRELLGADAGFRPHLAGHIAIEMLLDAYLTEQDPSQLDLFYDVVRRVSPLSLQNMVNRVAVRQTQKIRDFVPRFVSEGYLYDYLENDLIRYRLNRVLGHVKLAPLPEHIVDWLPSARDRVYINADRMLDFPLGPTAGRVADSSEQKK